MQYRFQYSKETMIELGITLKMRLYLWLNFEEQRVDEAITFEFVILTKKKEEVGNSQQRVNPIFILTPSSIVEELYNA